jgi:hypothetical protein
MRENILALECVLADAEATVVRAGTHALKSSAGSAGLTHAGPDLGCHYVGDCQTASHSRARGGGTCVFESLTGAAQAVAA